MLSYDDLLSIEEDALLETAIRLSSDALPNLVGTLLEKNDKIRYRAFQLLLFRSKQLADVYAFWPAFKSKLKDENSYQRSIGIMLMAENARWDSSHQLDNCLDDCLALLNDDRPITVRQTIQSLGTIAAFQPHLGRRIAEAMMSLDISAIRETMRKSILLDILDTLCAIRKSENIDGLDAYVLSALSGGLLDKKSIARIQALFV